MIDMNADMGESFGVYQLGNDLSLLKHITSANIACGYHAGDPTVMRKTVMAALDNEVAVGAHPGFPDLQGFGRRNMALTPEEVQDIILYQAGALNAFVRAAGARLQHIKPHGSLYNQAVQDEALAGAVAKAVARLGDDLILMGPSGSALEKAAAECSIPYAREVFADRAYDSRGQLAARSVEGALIRDETTCIQRMLSMLQGKPIPAIDGSMILLSGDTICLHGDHPESVAFARALRQAVINAGFTIAPLQRIIKSTS